jgi:hypothetical protein
MAALELRSLMDQALDVKSRIGLPVGPRGESDTKTEKGCRSPKAFATANASLERFELMNVGCDEVTPSMKASKKGAESFMVVYPTALPTAEALKQNPDQALPFPVALELQTLALNYNLSVKKDWANIDVFSNLHVSQVEENQTQIIYVASGKVSSNFKVNLYQTRDTGFMSVVLENVLVTVDKATRKTVAIGGNGSKVSTFVKADRYNKFEKAKYKLTDASGNDAEADKAADAGKPATNGGGKADRPRGFYESEAGQIGGSAEVMLSSVASLSADVCQVPELPWTAKVDGADVAISTAGLKLCSDGKPGFGYLYEGLFLK